MLIATLGGWVSGARGDSAPTVSDLLDAYAVGHDAAAQQAVAAGADSLRSFRTALARTAPAWTTASGTDNMPRRRLAVAAFALDAGHAALDATRLSLRAVRSPGDRWSREIRELRQMIEWACEFLRRDPTSAPVERDWFLASVQLIKDARDPVFLYGIAPSTPPDERARLEVEYGPLMINHLAHAIARFPDEPRFPLAAAEGLLADDKGREGFLLWGRQTIEVSDADPRAMQVGPSRDRDAAQRTYLRLAAHDLSQLESKPSVRAEIHLHLGAIALAFGQHAQAERYFDDIAPWTSDACLQYLGRFLHGRVEEMENRRDAAEVAYRAALAIVPRASSATTALAALLWLSDHPAEATSLIEAASPPSGRDPWDLLTGTQTCAEWNPLIANLRSEVR